MISSGRHFHYCYVYEDCKSETIVARKKWVKDSVELGDKVKWTPVAKAEGRKASTVTCIAYMFDNDDFVYGATKWRCPKNGVSFSKKAHRNTALGRLFKTPISGHEKHFSNYGRLDKKKILKHYAETRGVRGVRIRKSQQQESAPYPWLSLTW